jgi:hypothetical protein
MKRCESKMKFEEAQYNSSTLLKIKTSQKGMVAIKFVATKQGFRIHSCAIYRLKEKFLPMIFRHTEKEIIIQEVTKTVSFPCIKILTHYIHKWYAKIIQSLFNRLATPKKNPLECCSSLLKCSF